MQPAAQPSPERPLLCCRRDFFLFPLKDARNIQAAVKAIYYLFQDDPKLFDEQIKKLPREPTQKEYRWARKAAEGYFSLKVWKLCREAAKVVFAGKLQLFSYDFLKDIKRLDPPVTELNATIVKIETTDALQEFHVHLKLSDKKDYTLIKEAGKDKFSTAFILQSLSDLQIFVFISPALYLPDGQRVYLLYRPY